MLFTRADAARSLLAAAWALALLPVAARAQAEAAGAGRVLVAQTAARPASPRPSAESREIDAFLQAFRDVRSGCENAAWTLWHSNSYEGWRNRKSSGLTMNYSSRFFPSLPPAPKAWPESLRVRVEEATRRANDLLRDGGAAFKSLADYVNAKDYEDDKFKKGDELNKRLLAVGRECHAFYATLTELYGEIAELTIAQGSGAATRPDVVATMVSDWRRARELSRELAKGTDAERARLESLVREVSTLVEDRKREFATELGDSNGRLARFYDGMLNEDVAVPMRKLLREAKASPKVFKEAAADRPRSAFWRVRGEIDYLMPDAILFVIRNGP